MSFTDSFLDFDSIKNWFEDIPNPNMVDGAMVKIDGLEVDSCRETDVQEQAINQSDSNVVVSKPIDFGSHFNVKVEERECEMPRNLNGLIEEELGKVSLIGRSEKSVVGGEIDVKSELMDENGVKSERMSDEDESESSESGGEGTSSTSSSSSSTSSSSEDDEHDNDQEEEEEKEKEKDNVKVEVERKFKETSEVEEGELSDADGPDMAGHTHYDNENNVNDNDGGDNDDGDAMATWSDVDVADEEEDGGGATRGPIKSKNELEVPPSVPPVNATLQPHHHMLPVGVVLSILGTQVIVEGIEKHDPLNDGSILWITESRSPLGLVDEIFGPVKNPYYVVRYNSESEVPAGIHAGTSISFVTEFASHVLYNKDVYKKGYDASGANDEEVSDEAEFSDDEKEAEYKRMQKMTKRGTDDQKPRNNKNDKKKVKNRVEPWKNSQCSPQQTPIDAGHVPPSHHQHHLSPLSALADNGNSSTFFALGQGLVSGAGLVPQLPPISQTACFNPPSSGVWGNVPFQQPQGAFLPSGFPTYGVPWLSQNSQQFPFQMPMSNVLPYPQQVEPSQRFLSATLLPGEQSNPLTGSTYGQGLVFNQAAFGIGFQGQPSQPTLHAGEQGSVSNGLHIGHIFNAPQSGGIPGNNEASQQFSVGAPGCGRKPYRRGGGRFSRGRGGNQSR
ncbi:H/ACA ribonucleoprotein complex, subunit Gar1/Naf [Parasponia andersonii]|uniref:H/ACA ribonucleoprotein complex non-core subunit NAF1 n=1 Tax=Parasponia andersonii TaxID=3476 RepID=A0A2P5AEX0_PARAD|nr:H/ACA ribonucleoprotein complex, subunit Gar1/Naf [Parasponia andersonii]